VETAERIGVMFVGAAMFYTAVAPDNQTAKVIGAISSFFNGALRIVTGQVKPA